MIASIESENSSSNTKAIPVPHRRYNPLLGEWVLVSPQRTKRPWQGSVEDITTATAHDKTCYLCTGNTRVTGAVNPAYVGPYVFANDFPALLPDSELVEGDDDLLFRRRGVRGETHVICYSERHDLSMAQMSVVAIRKVVECWAQQYRKLAKRYEWVAIFENKGAAMGCSNPHPHGQIWASDFIPTEVAKEDSHQRTYFEQRGQALLLDYARREIDLGERVVFKTDHWVCVVPYWAIWPFETLLLPVGRAARLTDLGTAQRADLAVALHGLTVRYDNLFNTHFPYSMGWHGAPRSETSIEHWQLHAHFYPPLLRSASVRKFMVGYEMLAEAQRDLTPESAAAVLSEQPDMHYLNSRLFEDGNNALASADKVLSAPTRHRSDRSRRATPTGHIAGE